MTSLHAGHAPYSTFKEPSLRRRIRPPGGNYPLDPLGPLCGIAKAQFNAETSASRSRRRPYLPAIRKPSLPFAEAHVNTFSSPCRPSPSAALPAGLREARVDRHSSRREGEHIIADPGMSTLFSSPLPMPFPASAPAGLREARVDRRSPQRDREITIPPMAMSTTNPKKIRDLPPRRERSRANPRQYPASAAHLRDGRTPVHHPLSHVCDRTARALLILHHYRPAEINRQETSSPPPPSPCCPRR